VAKIWNEPFDSTRHQNKMFNGPAAEGLDLYWRAKTIEPHDVFFVRVAGFTFEFHSVEQIRTCLAFYARKIHPTSRLSIDGGDHWEFQRWFERLPLYLQEEPKRKKVVAALEEALKRTTEARR
jgi:hypothetical protein